MKRQENRITEAIGAIGRRAPSQLNQHLGSDTELISSRPGVLALATGTLPEELARGLIRDPETLGWLGVLAGLSDLAAVGAEPRGVMLSLGLPAGFGELQREALYRGIRGCLEAHDTWLLGGDSKRSDILQVSSTGIGHATTPLQRTGTRVGDVLYSIGEFGVGNLVALTGSGTPLGSPWEGQFRPRVPFRSWLQITKWVRSAIDTSNGLLAGLHGLSEASKIGLEIDLGRVPFHERVREIVESTALPLAGFAAGTVGDYGLLFTVPEEDVDGFEAEAEDSGLRPVRVGKAVDSPMIVLQDEAGTLPLHREEAESLIAADTAGELIGRLLAVERDGRVVRRS